MKSNVIDCARRPSRHRLLGFASEVEAARACQLHARVPRFGTTQAIDPMQAPWQDGGINNEQ
jgi:hypothetical protein